MPRAKQDEEEEDEGSFRDLINLIPAMWLPLALRQVMIRVIVTGFLGEPKPLPDRSNLEKYTGNGGKGGRPKKNQVAEVKTTGAFGGQATVSGELGLCFVG